MAVIDIIGTYSNYSYHQKISIDTNECRVATRQFKNEVNMKTETLEEMWERIKKYEEQGINPYESVDNFHCSDCSKCISVCIKRQQTDCCINS